MEDQKNSPHEPATAGEKIKSHMNRRYTLVSVYVIATVIIIFILMKIADNLDVIANYTGQGLHYIQMLLSPLIGGFVLAYLMFPLVGWVEKTLDKIHDPNKIKESKRRKHAKSKKNADEEASPRSNRGLAIAISILFILLVLALGISILLTAFTHELTTFSLDAVTQYLQSVSNSLKNTYSQLREWMKSVNINSQVLTDFANGVTKWVGGIASGAGNALSASLGNVTGLFANTIFAIIFALYFLSDYKGLEKYWDNVLKAVTSKRIYDKIHVGINDMDQVFSGYIRGQLLDAGVMAVLISIVLAILNVKFAVIIGVLAGIGNLIPYVGPFVGYIGSALVCVLDGDFKKMIIAIIAVFIVSTLDGNLIEPRLLSGSIDIHPMLVILGLIVGSAVGGLGGMILAVPVAALLKIWFDRIIQKLSSKRHL